MKQLAKKAKLGIKGTYNGGEDWQYVTLNGVGIGEIACFSDGSIHIHNALKERGNSRELRGVKTKGKGAKLLAQDYIEFALAEYNYFSSALKRIGANAAEVADLPNKFKIAQNRDEATND